MVPSGLPTADAGETHGVAGDARVTLRCIGREERGPTFADVVRALKDAPAVAVPEPPPTTVELVGTQVRFPDGRAYTRDGDVHPAAARRHVLAGAELLWDACGCGGGCPLTTPDLDEVRRAAAAGPPRVAATKRRTGELSLWRADDGWFLVLAQGWVFWGDALA